MILRLFLANSRNTQKDPQAVGEVTIFIFATNV